MCAGQAAQGGGAERGGCGGSEEGKIVVYTRCHMRDYFEISRARFRGPGVRCGRQRRLADAQPGHGGRSSRRLDRCFGTHDLRPRMTIGGGRNGHGEQDSALTKGSYFLVGMDLKRLCGIGPIEI